ncbi:MAG: GWxTD domain-containing protein [candidate division Zixibacteria bacterium]|nr:GWxTD domain-containing protein [candidate division Zixibacteria bacterium]
MMKRTHTSAIVVLTAFLGLSLPVVGQIGYSEGKREVFNDYLMTDYAYFRADDSNLVRLDLYYQVHNRGLSFSLSEGRYLANYELSITLLSRINLQEMEIKLASLHEKTPVMSGVEFAQAFQKSTERESVFSKGDILVVPSVSRLFGSLDSDRIVYYYEIYPGSDSAEKVVVETRIRHNRQGMIYRDTLHLELGEKPERELREVSLKDFLPGEYELDIALLGRRNKKLDGATQLFRVAWTQEGMLRNDWKATVQQLKLFSEDVDVGDMEGLKTFEERVKAFDLFWAERDPTEGTAENEAKAAFYYRVRIADERFGVMRMDGWRTDRGRIYIQYGEPDFLVEEPFSLSNHPYQVWQYTRISPTRQFVFVDENEDGDYRLQYPYDGLNNIGSY